MFIRRRDKQKVIWPYNEIHNKKEQTIDIYNNVLNLKNMLAKGQKQFMLYDSFHLKF